MSYEFYKVLHLVAIFTFLASVGASFYAPERPKMVKILAGISSFIILVAGMGLLARIGGGWPTWAIIKMILWAILAIGAPIAAKRLQSVRNVVFISFIIFAGGAAWLAVIKPF
jgi:uncharacterized membrane protein SirB2